MALTNIADIRFFGGMSGKITRERTRVEISGNREEEAVQKRLPGPAGSPGRVKAGDLPGGEGCGGECSLKVVAPGIAVDIEHLADAIEAFGGL